MKQSILRAGVWVVVIFSCITGLAQTEIDSLKTLIPQKEGEEKVEVLHQLAEAYKELHDYNKSLDYYLKNLELNRELGNKGQVAVNLNNIGIIHRRLKNYAQALDYYNRSIKMKEELGDRLGIAKTSNNMGVAYKNMEEYDKALEHYLKAIRIKEELGRKESLAKSLNNVGIILRQLEDYNKALDYYSRALRIKEELNDKKGRAITMNNMGIVYLHMGKYDKALEYSKKSLAMKRELDYKKGIAISLNNMGKIYSSKENNKKALNYYLKSLEIKKEIGEESALAVTHNNLANIYIELGKMVKARQHLEKNLEIAKNINARDKIMKNYRITSKLYAFQNDYDKAYKYQRLYTQLKDTLQAEQNKKRVALIEGKYQFEKKKREMEFQKEKKLQNIRLYGILGFLLLFIGFSVVIYSRYRLKKRSNRALSEKTRELEEQKQALARSKARYSELVEYAGEVILVEQDGLCKYINPRVKDMTGYESHEMDGKAFVDHIHPDDRQFVKAIHPKITAGEEKSRLYSCRIIDKKAETRWIENNVVRIEWDGKPATLNFITDITERKEAEMNLREREAALEAIAEAADEFLTATDIEEPVNHMLKQLCEALEASSAFIFERKDSGDGKFYTGMSYEFVREGTTPRKDYPEFQKMDITALEEHLQMGIFEKRKSFSGLIKNFPEEQRKYFEKCGSKSFIVVPIYVFDEVYGYIGFDERNYDRFWSKPEEEALKSAADLLASAIMKKRMEKELVASKEKAEESDRLKSAFLANMSHEIRTPMNGILGFADLLKEPELSEEEKRHHVNIIEKSGRRMLNIINDLIDISKIESGQMEVSIEEINVSEEIEEQYEFFEPEARNKGLSLYREKGLPDSKAKVQSDPDKLQAILTNLVKNAIKYTMEGYIKLGYYHKGEVLEFFVKDTGQGIKDERRKAIFDRFVQAEYEINKQQEGAGMGLAITKAYVDMLGGEIWADSEYGKGTVFYFTIPDMPVESIEPDVDKPVSATSAPEVNEYEGEDLSNCTIYIAEDEESSNQFLTRILEKRCKKILHTNDGKEVVEMVRENPDVDVILMDIKMPKMDGYEATRKIREFNKDVRIIAQTAYALEGDREKALEAGCDAYIAKPIKKEELLKLLVRQ